jgi:hypothetical protein
MTRLFLTLSAWLCLVSLASATLSPRKETSRLDNSVPKALASKASNVLVKNSEQTERGTPSDYIMTEETEVLLNGNLCNYKEIPDHASIERMEVGIDKKTVLRVHFRTRK